MDVKFLEVCEDIKKYLVPHKTNFKKIRIGHQSDGGYVICDGLPEYDALYSYGSDDNITFEKDFYNHFQKESYVYDHTIDGITDKPDYIHFFKEGVYSQKTENMDTIDNHIIKNGHTECKNLFAQIDIEGYEWVILNKDSKYIDNFSQVILELHFHHDVMRIIQFENVYLDVLKFMNEKFVCVHVHGNNHPIQPWLDLNFPTVIEVTFVRKDLITSSEPDNQTYPLEGLDNPCAIGRPDLKLDYWFNKPK